MPKYDNGKAMWKNDIKAAKELGYSDEIVQKIENESDPNKRTRILHDARKAAADREDTLYEQHARILKKARERALRRAATCRKKY